MPKNIDEALCEDCEGTGERCAECAEWEDVCQCDEFEPDTCWTCAGEGLVQS